MNGTARPYGLFWCIKFSSSKSKIDLYSALLWEERLWSAHVWITVFTLQTHNTCLYLISVHQTAPPLSSDSSHLIAAYYSFIDPRGMKGWVSWPSWLTIQQTVYPYKWLPINCRSGAVQGKFAGQRPMFYHWATQPTIAIYGYSDILVENCNFFPTPLRLTPPFGVFPL